MSADIQKLFASVADPMFKETVRDFLVNQRFRRDIFVRGPRQLPAGVHNEALLSTPVALVRPSAECKLEVSIGSVNVTLKPEIYRPILEALEHQPMTANELMQVPGIREQGVQRVVQALLVLIGAGHGQPCTSEAAAAAAAEGTQRFNRAVCARTAQGYPTLNNLASPVLGSGIALGRIAKLFLDAHLQGKGDAPEVWAQHAWSMIKSMGQVVFKDNQRLEGDEANLAELTSQAREFKSGGAILKPLGIAEF